MKNNLTVKVLIDLAQRDTDTALRHLGRAQHERSAAQAQLDALIHYRDEYRTSFSVSAQAGMPASGCRNFQAFIDNLDAAIGQQRRLLATATTHAETAKPAWQQQKRTLNTYQTLYARSKAVEMRHLARLEQRETDEHAAKMRRMRQD